MRLINILLVEDDEVDKMDIMRTLDKLDILYQLNAVNNGEEAIEYLKQKSQAGAEMLPDIVLVDINMPKMNGLELLSTIRETEEWRHLKCFIITTSDQQKDRREAEKLGAAGYIIKPFKVSTPKFIDSLNLMVELINFKK